MSKLEWRRHVGVCLGWSQESDWQGNMWALQKLQLDELARARLGKVLIAERNFSETRCMLRHFKQGTDYCSLEESEGLLGCGELRGVRHDGLLMSNLSRAWPIWTNMLVKGLKRASCVYVCTHICVLYLHVHLYT